MVGGEGDKNEEMSRRLSSTQEWELYSLALIL